jgi:TDG/mug DNA glycosylase family protein
MRTLPDYLRRGMRLVIVGTNPGENSVRSGHYYSGRDSQFWQLLYEGGVVPEPLEANEDKRMIEFGIGLTDLVKRPTRRLEEIRREEWTEGRVLLSQKLQEFQPRVVAFHGKTAYEKFFGRPCKLGLQKETLYGAQVFVLPSTSGQNATISLAAKKKYFQQLGQLLKKSKAAAG